MCKPCKMQVHADCPSTSTIQFPNFCASQNPAEASNVVNTVKVNFLIAICSKIFLF